MKKRRKVGSILMILLIGIILSFATIEKIQADSGFDTDYGGSSGGGWSSGGGGWSSGGSDFDFGSGSGGGSMDLGGEIALIVTVVMIVLSIVIKSIKSSSNAPKYLSPAKNFYTDMPDERLNEILSDEKVKEILPDFNKEQFKKQAFEIYKNIQLAWMNFDYEKIRKHTTDEMYNMYSMQLDTLKVKNQRNIMANIHYLDAKVINMKEENGIVKVDTYLKVSCYDYIINDNTKKVVRGNSKKALTIEYILTFVRSKDNSEGNKVKCPNCGAEVEMNASATCEYCGSTLVKDASEFVLAKKQNIAQR